MPVNKDIAMCVPRLQEAWALLSANWVKLYPNGPKIILVETYRSPAVQAAYYAQGREPLAEVNKLRKAVGLYLLTEKENKGKITNAKPGQSKHQVNPSKAFDIGFVVGGKMDYSPGHYQQADDILRPLCPDVTWGADWNRNGKTSDEHFIDRPHFEVH